MCAINLVFDTFARRGSVNGLLRWLVKYDVKLPIRPHFGSKRGELEERRPNRATLSGAVLESFVCERLLQAVSPASLELGLAAGIDIEHER